MSQEAKYANGESILSQSHAAGKIEPVYTNGESGGVPFDQYVAILFLMSREAKYANGESVLPQARPTQNIEWAWANGESGSVGANEYVAPFQFFSIEQPLAFLHKKQIVGY